MRSELHPIFDAAGWTIGGDPVSATEELLRDLERGPEPDAAANRLASVIESAPGLARAALVDRVLGDALVAVCGASRALTNEIVRLGDAAQDVLTRDSPPAALAFDHPTLLRHEMADHVLAAAAADLSGRINMPQVGEWLSAMADTAVRRALAAVGDPAVNLTVIALGKWGGRELNYASDIDLVVVHEGDESAAVATVARVIELLSTRASDGYTLRCDLDLRPEGAAGALSRSLDSYRTYWQRWAEPWEAQAMLKARVAAGDPELGAAFLEAVQHHVYPATLGADTVRSMRAMKTRTEALVAGPDELKRGVGGIRDVEFAVQMLQLVHGRQDRTLRSANTLEGLGALAEGGYLDDGEAADFAESYRWLRHIEHRLQLYDLRQTHSLPPDPATRERVAKAAGYRDASAHSALQAFEADLNTHRARVRLTHERLFYRPLMEAFADTAAEAAPSTQRQVVALGFSDSAALRFAIAELTAGLSRRGGLMRQLLPMLLQWLAESPDPDLGLAQLQRLATRGPNEEALVSVLRDDPAAGERLCRLLGTSRLAGPLASKLSLATLRLGDDAALRHEPDRRALAEEAIQRMIGRTTIAERAESIRRFYAEQLLEISAADVGGTADQRSVARRLSAAADSILVAALQSAIDAVAPDGDAPPMAVIGVGKLGGHELDYASDLDLLVVYERADHHGDETANRVVENLISLFGPSPVDLPLPEIDFGLRPDGKKGSLARSMDAYRDYWARSAHTWERQALVRSRFVAGDADLGETFVAAAIETATGVPPDSEQIREIRAMKARVETERIPVGEDPDFHVKLGRGAMSDVEWTVQLLQMQHGSAHPAIVNASTRDGLAALADAGLLAESDAEALETAYNFCARVRNRLFHLVGRAKDSLPTDADQAARVAISLGYDLHPRTALREEYRMVTRRSRRVVERIFYGR